MNRQLHSSRIINTNHDTYRTGLFGNLKHFNFALLLLPLHPGKQQYWLQFIMDLHKFIIH